MKGKVLISTRHKCQPRCTKQKQILTKMFTPSVNPKGFTTNPCRVIHFNPLDQESEEKFMDVHNPVCAHCIGLYMACDTFLQTFPHRDPVFVNGQIRHFLHQSFAGTNAFHSSVIHYLLLLYVFVNYVRHLHNSICLSSLLGTFCISTSYLCIL